MQVLQWVLSYDFVHSPEPLAITAAGAALALSDVPMNNVVAGVRVGRVKGGGGFIVNPTVEEMEGGELDMVIAGTKDAVLMIEGFCDFLSEEEMLEVRGRLVVVVVAVVVVRRRRRRRRRRRFVGAGDVNSNRILEVSHSRFLNGKQNDTILRTVSEAPRRR